MFAHSSEITKTSRSILRNSSAVLHVCWCLYQFVPGLTVSIACSTSFQTHMPHRLRAIAGHRMVYSVPLIIFMDDVSANVSKQWNKHHAIYMSNANLPRQMLEKEFCIRFVTSSPDAPPMELMRVMKDSIA
jgi:hypothetical protein